MLFSGTDFPTLKQNKTPQNQIGDVASTLPTYALEVTDIVSYKSKLFELWAVFSLPFWGDLSHITKK